MNSQSGEVKFEEKERLFVQTDFILTLFLKRPRAFWGASPPSLSFF